MTSDEDFAEFFRSIEPKLRLALSAEFGFHLGRDAAAFSLAYAWEHWRRVRGLKNPPGYLYRVGQRYGRRQRGARTLLPPGTTSIEVPWIEPKLSHALELLSRQQRIVVVLVHGLEWTQVEVADFLGIRPTTVQNHLERGMARLRRELEATNAH